MLSGESFKENLARLSNLEAIGAKVIEYYETENKKNDELLNRLRKAPLMVVNMNVSPEDKKRVAGQMAKVALEEELNSETKRSWKKSLFRKHYERKYRREFLRGKRSLKNDLGETLSLEDALNLVNSGHPDFKNGRTPVETFLLDITAGHDLDDFSEVASPETTARIRGAIETYAMADADADEKELKSNLLATIRDIRQDADDQGEDLDYDAIGNYERVAIEARELVLAEESIENVMEGFQVFNTDSIHEACDKNSVDSMVRMMNIRNVLAQWKYRSNRRPERERSPKKPVYPVEDLDELALAAA